MSNMEDKGIYAVSSPKDKVLVLGGSGFIGLRLVKRLRQEG